MLLQAAGGKEDPGGIRSSECSLTSSRGASFSIARELLYLVACEVSMAEPLCLSTGSMQVALHAGESSEEEDCIC